MLVLQCCALLKFLVVDDQSMCNFMLLTKLATYMQYLYMRNSNLGPVVRRKISA